MNTPVRQSFHGFEQLPLKDYVERAYLDYSMYVVLDRALPFIGDGLKPVQRRIIYAMSELGLEAGAKPKKSARTVGDVIGKFHPHGDSACYEAMVLMAQEFSFRYPLINGQGNFGSADDPKSFAAMRYTESKLTPIANILLAELGQGTVDWVPNFDGTLQEPSWMPARLPHILLNGTTGIAVGMATDIPPHNVREVAAACIRLIDDPEATVTDLCEHIQAPDFATVAEIITPKAELLQMYSTGYGSVRCRAVYEAVHDNVVITAMPYQVSSSKVQQQIADQMRAKKLPMVEDIRDESDHQNACRLVLVLRSNRVDIEELMRHLFATTDLEKSYRVNLNVIGLDGKPQLKNLKVILNEWITFRRDTVRKRLQYRLEKVEKRLHVLEGLRIAYLNLDEVIHIIRNEDEPRAQLVTRFGLTDIQVDYILDTRLRQLARLEEMKIRGEMDTLEEERAQINVILASKQRLNTLIKQEIRSDAETYGDARRAPLVIRQAAIALSETSLVASEPTTIILSEKGWVRAAKGHEVDPAGLSYREGDGLLAFAKGRTNQQAVFIDSSGRAYSTAAHSLPSARGHGEPLTGRFTLPVGEMMSTALLGDEKSQWVMATTQGYGFITSYESLLSRNKNGKQIITVASGAQILPPGQITEVARDRIIVVTTDGHLLMFSVAELPQLDKGKGNKLIDIPKTKNNVAVVCAGVVVIAEGADIVIQAGNRTLTLKWKDLMAYSGSRAQRGGLLPKGLQRVTGIAVKSS